MGIAPGVCVLSGDMCDRRPRPPPPRLFPLAVCTRMRCIALYCLHHDFGPHRACVPFGSIGSPGVGVAPTAPTSACRPCYPSSHAHSPTPSASSQARKHALLQRIVNEQQQYIEQMEVCVAGGDGAREGGGQHFALHVHPLSLTLDLGLVLPPLPPLPAMSPVRSTCSRVA